ncbi:phosphoglycolate phosphatase [Mediterraneibacter butyricigenes]|jgi:phosphoglycolate phosphatase|uniref:Phosphoglycolate phosphatase n=1 Tax=Mediterraneibacter butyricigenes TaxID=2316025 RepID=A0A391P5C7_9FIRM|nr:HAD family hydrolase [Mediterraneibacter butyricigenes]RGO27797.1 HAD family hydrolase [Dorea sp. OM02-2LB]RGV95452.1 HAD family hydrolase [Ruminococcus sp. AF14-10]GCA65978.1 phosphoglycolate phosphatase [Mediterraneibacter butyricigenes]
MFRLCIFDLDGTLTDTLDSLTYSVNLTLEEMGYPALERSKCRAFVGNGSRVLIEKALKASGDTTLSRIEEGMEVYDRVFDANCTYHVTPYDGIVELLQALKEKGMKLTVLSNKPHRQAVHVVEEVFGKEMFDWVQGQQEGIPRKPDPYAAIQIAEKFGVKPEECVYIGDSEVDVATGTAARMKTLGVTWGFRSVEQLKEAGATILLDRPVQILEEINKGGI